MSSLDAEIRAALDTPEHRAHRASEEQLVRDLGEAIGYGRVMQLCERLWREMLIAQGLPGGELSVGACAGSLVPCPCPAPGRDPNGHCTWCCGAGRVTERVLRAMQRPARRRSGGRP